MEGKREIFTEKLCFKDEQSDESTGESICIDFFYSIKLAF